MAERLRLDKLLCYMGAVDSRAAAKEAARAGRAQVNGVVERDSGRLLDPNRAAVFLDGRRLEYRRWRYVMLHKPSGVITAAKGGRAVTVMDLLPPLYTVCGCMPAGRLDKDTEGLLLLSNDGTLVHRLLSPRTGIVKRYLAKVDGPLGEEDTRAFGNGLPLAGFTALPSALNILESGPESARAICDVCEGKYHQVKRMFAARGRQVVYLKRLSIGPLELDPALAPGAFRELTSVETDALYTAVGLQRPKEL